MDLGFFDSLIKGAIKITPKSVSNRWKYCIALVEDGWRVDGYEKVSKKMTTDIIIKWVKEGEAGVDIRLSFAEQTKLVVYMDNRVKKVG